MIVAYPERVELDLSMRPLLHPLFQALPDGISEFTFANLYLFRKAHRYRISRLPGEGLYVITGNDVAGLCASRPFFMLPFGLPKEEGLLKELFEKEGYLKSAPEAMARELEKAGYLAEEDRDNFDYLYSREEMAALAGRKFHRRKNLYNAFVRTHQAEGRPLLDEYEPQAAAILETWLSEREGPGDYEAAREALERMGELQLCGGIYLVDEKPVAYTLGEELAGGKMFVIHFEKAIHPARYKGIYQYLSKAFAEILPEKYETINREQDLGEDGLRQSKESYNPVGFVRKFRVRGV